MQFFRRASGRPSAVGILPGTFNPVTVAHLALARAALQHVHEVVFVLPRNLPHKTYAGASFDDRVDMLTGAVSSSEPFSVAASDGGLFLEIAEECRCEYGETAALTLLCGRDAAERMIGWDYGAEGAVENVFGKCCLLVAARSGEFTPPDRFVQAIRALPLDGEFDHVSATEVRERLSAGLPWEHLAPPAIHGQISRIYSVTALNRLLH